MISRDPDVANNSLIASNTSSASDGQALRFSTLFGTSIYEDVPERNISRVSGRCYGPELPFVTTVLGTFTPTLSTIYFVPFYSPRKTVYSRMGIKNGSNASGTNVVRLGIYSNLRGKPSSRITDYGSILLNSSNALVEATISSSLSGWYWLAVRMGSASAIGTITSVTSGASSTSYGYSSLIGTTTNSSIYLGNSAPLGWSLASGLSTGTMPASITQASLISETTVLLPYMKVQ